MQTNTACNEVLSRLGFGTMRLPVDKNGNVDQNQLEQMTDYAISHGINYFDTALPYMNGQSETAIGKALSRYERNKWYLATKFPGHQIAPSYNPEEVFNEQLKNCAVEYFDFYLLHNVYENSIPVYEDKRWSIIPFFLQQREKGKIRHLGISSHARPETLADFLDKYKCEFEFVQIELNYLDWTLQNAKEKYELLTERNIPIWVMEPVRGGKLADLPTDITKNLRILRPTESCAAWAFRWLLNLPNVKMILSGMSNLTQMKDNIFTFSNNCPLSSSEENLLLTISETLKDSVPCSACRYCCKECPKKLDIPMLIRIYNDLHYQLGTNPSMQMDTVAPDKRPENCIQCGKCKQICPQNIDIPSILQQLKDLYKKAPQWAEECAKRAAVREQQRNRK